MLGSGILWKKNKQQRSVNRVPISLILTLCLSPNLTIAGEYYGISGAQQESREEQKHDIGQARAAAIAQSRYGGKVLKINRQNGIYHIKLLLPSGTVKSVSVDASSGALL